MRGIEYSSVLYRTDNGGYEFANAAWAALRSAGLTDNIGDTGQELVPWPMDDNGDNPDGPSWIVTEQDEPDIDAAIAALTPLGAEEVEVGVVDAGIAYSVMRDVLAARNDALRAAGVGATVRWMGMSVNDMLYIVVEE